MNTEKQPGLCTTLYRKPMQPCNIVGILYQLRHWFFSHGFHQKIRFERNFKKRRKSDFLHSKTKISEIVGVLFVESDGEGPRSKFEQKDRQTDREKMARASVCDASGTTSPSCTVTWAIRNVQDQLESIRTRPAKENLQRSVEFETIPQLRILDIWNQWRNTGCVVVTWDFLAIFSRLFDCLPVWILTSNLHHRTLRKKSLPDQRFWFWSAVFLSSYLTLSTNVKIGTLALISCPWV